MKFCIFCLFENLLTMPTRKLSINHSQLIAFDFSQVRARLANGLSGPSHLIGSAC